MVQPKIFTIDLLNQYVNQYNAKLIKDYNNEINRTSLIEYICNCGTIASKIFRDIQRGAGMICKECCRVNKNKKIGEASKKNNTIQKLHEYNLKQYNSKGPLGNKEMVQKMKATMEIKYGVQHAMQNNELKNKAVNTNLNKYGVNTPSKNDIIKEKIKTSLNKIYSDPNNRKCKDIKYKTRATNLQRFKTNHPSQTLEFKEKRKATFLKRYGVKFPLQNNIIKQKQIETVIKKFGVCNPGQSKELQEKIQKQSLKYKDYSMPSDSVRRIQGYENLALDELIKFYDETDIITAKKEIPHIKYIYNNKERYYFPDIFILSQNTIIEVKSDYTYTCDLEINTLKKNACIEQGYKFEFWIYDKRGEKQVIN